MRKKLFGKGIAPACVYCASGTLSNDKKVVFCIKKGIVRPDFSCRRFSYDPIKRVPKVPPEIDVFDKSDFEL